MARIVKTRLNDCECGCSDLEVDGLFPGSWTVRCKSCGRTTRMCTSRREAIGKWNSGLVEVRGMHYRDWLKGELWVGEPENAPC